MTYLGGAGAAGAGESLLLEPGAGETGAGAAADVAAALVRLVGAAAAACLSCVGEPGTTCVLAAGFFGSEVASGLVKHGLLLRGIAKAKLRKVLGLCLEDFGGVIGERSWARGSKPSFEPLVAWMMVNSTAKPAKAPSTHRKVAPAF
jgi:hypothetical protein